ncbi:hypothetical protein ACS0TY_008005 [Phlomoides rotata]
MLDRFLINNEWLMKWPSAHQVGLRSLSDHCPILLKIKVIDWGSKPFRFVNAWLSYPEFKDFVINKWRNYSVIGWGGYVIKEKFKKLKAGLKTWNRDVFRSLNKKIEDRRREILILDIMDDTFGLDDEEIMIRNRERAQLLIDLKDKDNLLLQKARYNWIKDGDANTRFFHNCINKRRKNNEITKIKLGGEWVEEATEVKKGLVEYVMSERSFQQASFYLYNY